MQKVMRRDALKVLGAAALTASGATALGKQAFAVPGLQYPTEKGAELKLLRWKTFVQADEDQWLANTRRFTEQTGVRVLVENINLSEIRSKAHVAASVGDGPDILMGGGMTRNSIQTSVWS